MSWETEELLCDCGESATSTADEVQCYKHNQTDFYGEGGGMGEGRKMAFVSGVSVCKRAKKPLEIYGCSKLKFIKAT